MEKSRLSEAEWKIMAMLWDNGPMTITQLTTALAPKTGWEKHTVITLLKRMEKKGAVSYEQGKNAKSFYSTMKREEVAPWETKNFLERIYSGSLGMMMNFLVEQKSLSKDDIDELYGILKKAETEEENK